MVTDWRKQLDRSKGIFREPPKNVPSNRVVDGPLIGNGDVGVVLSGPPERQRLWISKTDFWKTKPIYPNGSPCLMGGIDIHIPELARASYYSEQRLLEGKSRVNVSRGRIVSNLGNWVSATDRCWSWS